MDKITEKTTPIAVTDKVNEIIDEISLKGAVSSVNGKTPDSSGNVTITAEDTGARPDSWTPTAAEVGAATSGHTHSAATTSAGGFMSAADKTKLNGVATGANNYVLPVAGTALGGVKNGGNVTVNADGTMTAPEGGGSGGAVESVNGKTGAVTLTAADVSALSKTAQAVTNWDTATNTGLYTSDLTAQNLPDMEADSSGGVCNGLTINDAQFIMCSDYSMMNIWAGYRHYMGSGYFTEWTQFLSSSSGFSAITVTDWNNATQTGFYTSNADADNAPYPYTYDTCFGFVIANTSAAQQFVFRESKASNGIVDNALYTRSVRLNSRPVYYGEWQLVNKQAAADVPITAISGMTATTVQEALEENFQSVVDGKSSLETAITDKGGTVSKAGDVATFAELTAGVNSISGGGDDPFTPVQDGKTRIYISLQEGRTSPMLGVCPNGTVIVDWGDGTATDTLTGTSTSTYAWTPKHNYAAPGNYVITLSVDGIMGLIGGSSSGAGTPILRNSSDTDSANRAYSGSIYSVEIGENAVIGAAAFNRCDRMKNIFIPDSVTSIGINAFQYCYNLSSVSIPNGITKIDNYTFQYCYSLSSVSIPSSVTSIGTNAFSACYSLSNISIPDGVTIINTNSFNSCYHLSAVYFPGSVKTINSNAFSSCSGVAYFDFTKHTSVPALSATSAFSNIAADAQIRVPMELVDEWKAATNWATYASQIVGV
ncbi:leucine-rich repeat protein [Ligaoa zhengdingensis]